jgi:pimeloyl-ACP methyl ester carboxylesterase
LLKTHTSREARHYCRAFLLFGVLFFLQACQGYLLFDPANAVRDEVQAKGWGETFFPFKKIGGLVGFYRPLSTGSPVLHVYIEGDGFAWKNSWTPSSDPTPFTPVGLNLAFSDPEPAVLYISRPCQYQRRPPWTGCQTRYWTGSRFASEVVEATSRAISTYKIKVGAGRVRLIGFSGGGAIAALVTARRNDVEYLVTIASPLDHSVWTNHHDITPLFGSLNPIDVASKLYKIPQTHFVGGEDKIVPQLVAKAFLRSFPDVTQAKIQLMPKFGHLCCWAETWQSQLKGLDF